MANLPDFPSIPAVTPVTDPVVSSILRPMRESLLIITGALSGSPLANGTVITTGLNPVITNPVLPSGTEDFSTPPAPTGFTATGAFATIILSWNGASFSSYAYTEIWRASINALGAASLIGSTPGNVFSDAIGNNTTDYYWIRFVNKAGIKGPYNAPGGTAGTTAINPALVIASLTNSITTTQLYSDLAAEIALIPGLSTSVAANTANISTISSHQVTQDASIATLTTQVSANTTSISTLNGNVTSNTAAITTLQSTQTSQGSSIASLTTTVSSQGTTISSQGTQIASNTASISTQATSISGLQAQYTVKIDVNGYVSGFGLASTPVNGTPYSTFIVRADSFSIGAPGSTSPSPTLPFIVQTSGTTVNGVYRPPGTYIQDAYIANGVIGNAQIGNAAIDSAKVSSLTADKLATGSVTVGTTISSASTTGGTPTWSINGSGAATFQNITAVGSVQAGTATYSGGTVSGSGAALNSNGTFALGNSSANMTFNGSTFNISGSQFQVGTAALSGGSSSSATTMSGSGAVLYPSGAFALGGSSTNPLGVTQSIVNSSSGIYINGFTTQFNAAVAGGSSIASPLTLITFTVTAANANSYGLLTTTFSLLHILAGNTASTECITSINVTLSCSSPYYSATYNAVNIIPCALKLYTGGISSFSGQQLSFDFPLKVPAGTYTLSISGTNIFHDNGGGLQGYGVVVASDCYSTWYQAQV